MAAAMSPPRPARVPPPVRTSARGAKAPPVPDLLSTPRTAARLEVIAEPGSASGRTNESARWVPGHPHPTSAPPARPGDRPPAAESLRLYRNHFTDARVLTERSASSPSPMQLPSRSSGSVHARSGVTPLVPLAPPAPRRPTRHGPHFHTPASLLRLRPTKSISPPALSSLISTRRR